jgi:hypothetical protein
VPHPAAKSSPTPQQAVAGQELSGEWRGGYVEEGSSTVRSEVAIHLSELNGSQIEGTLTFRTVNHASGQCGLLGSKYSHNQLLLLVHCGPSGAPDYFRRPVMFSVGDPSARKLTGKLYGENVDVNIERQ